MGRGARGRPGPGLATARPPRFEAFSAAIDPQWIADALAATGTVSVRRRKLPAEHVVWRPLALDDLAYVAALEAQIHLAPWTLGNFRDALAAGYSARVGERDGRVLAYGVLMLAPGEAQLLNLSVVPDCRRQGLGRMLLAQFVDDARRLGAEQMFLEVRVGNTRLSLRKREAGGVTVRPV